MIKKFYTVKCLLTIFTAAMCAEPELWLYRRSNIDNPQIFTVDTPNLSNMDPSIPTWFFIHGASSNCSYDIPNTKIILNETDSNVILVNWPETAGKPYMDACFAMPDMARKLGGFISHLKSNGFDDTKMKVVGFSLGAHFAGAACKAVTGGFNGYLVGLSAPSVPFIIFNDNDKLTKDDAPYVEFFHVSGSLGEMFTPVGHRDYYINGGMYQPGCKLSLTLEDMLCSHAKATEVYSKLLAGEPLKAKRCDDAQQAVLNLCQAEYEVVPRETAFQKKDAGIYYLKH